MDKSHKSILLCIFLLSFDAQASWPQFLPPSTAFLLTNNYIDLEHCPPGQGKIREGTILSMQSLCNFCPGSWTFRARSDGACHDLTTGFSFHDYEFVYYPDNDDDDDGAVLYSKVTAYYGEKNSNEHYLAFVFVSPKEHWYCIKASPEFLTIICANDI